MKHLSGLVLLFLMVFKSAPMVAGAVSPLPEVLRNTPPDRQLEIHFTDGAFTRGRAVAVRNDTLYLQRPEDPAQLSAYALARITGVYTWRSNSGRGAGWGATSGAIIVGSFGVLMGAYLASIDGSDGDDIGPALGVGLLGAGVGAAGGSLVGLGVGSLSSSWYEIWPRNQVVKEYARPARSEATRLGLFAGWGRPLLTGYEVSRFTGRVSLRKSLGRLVSLGPEISFHSFEGTAPAVSPYRTYQSGKENLLKVALATNVRSRRRGLSPYTTLGIGWFLSNDAYIGAHFGGGLRWQYKGGNDLEFDIRYHTKLTPVDPGEVDQFWTLGLSFGLAL